LSDDTAVVTEWSDLFMDLARNHPDLSVLDESQLQILETVLTALQNGDKLPVTIEVVTVISKVIEATDKSRSTDTIDGFSIDQIRDWCFFPETIRQYKSLNCSASATTLTAVLKKLGGSADYASPNGHAVTFVEIDGKHYYVDPRNFTSGNGSHFISEMTDYDRAVTTRGHIKLYKSTTGIDKTTYRNVPFFKSLQEGVHDHVGENTREMMQRANKDPNGVEAYVVNRTNPATIQSVLAYPTSPDFQEYLKSDDYKTEEELLSLEDNVSSSLRNFAKKLDEPLREKLIALLKGDSLVAVTNLFLSEPAQVPQMITAFSLYGLSPAEIEQLNAAHTSFYEESLPTRQLSAGVFRQQVEDNLRRVGA
jgi:hypothetical protein